MSDGRQAWGEERSQTVTWNDPMPALRIAATLSGLDYLRGMRDGIYPPPPISMLLGMDIVTVEEGFVTFALTPHESHFNPIGVVHGGVLATLLDSVTGCAVHSTLAAGWRYTSIDITVNYLRAVDLRTGPILFTGRLVKGGRRVAFTTAEATDSSGNVLATASSSLLVIAPD